MLQVDDETFDKLVSDGIDAIPEKYYEKIHNVGFVTQDWPTEEQRAKFHLGPHQTLFGLYEGIPLTKRTAGYNLVIPDKITIFKLPMLHAAATLEDLAEEVRHTVWHEVAHYFGLGHQQIHSLDGTLQD